MADVNSNPGLLASILDRLEPLPADNYVLAFGPDNNVFYATPSGYAATYLPARVLAELASDQVRRVRWASFGDENESWFFAYELVDGTICVRLGKDSPQALHEYIDDINKVSKSLLGCLCVQLGKDGSFVVWSKTAWACFNVPKSLVDRLCQLSSGFRSYNGLTKGSFKGPSIKNIAWHQDGTCFLRTDGDQVSWLFCGEALNEAWEKLWSGTGVPGLSRDQVAELAYVAIDPHAPTSTTFALIKKQQPAIGAPYTVHFHDQPVHYHLPVGNRQLQVAKKIPTGGFQWAVAKRSGRTHADAWEVEVKKGEKVKVWRDMGQDWWIIETKKGKTGYCHGSWLDFGAVVQQEERGAHQRLLKDLAEQLELGLIKKFPSMADYVPVCAVAGCRAAAVLPGVCVHNLAQMLQGSDRYSAEFLKKDRLAWHPDKFAKWCAPEAAKDLKAKAEQVFKLFGILLEEVEEKAGGSQ